MTVFNNGFCIPREQMPQVDMEDMARLKEWLRKRGFTVEEGFMPTRTLIPVQCPQQIRPVRREAMLVKPILVSVEDYILDGNHRHATFLTKGMPDCPTVRIHANFRACCEEILKFPGAYTYGDGKLHPCKW